MNRRKTKEERKEERKEYNRFRSIKMNNDLLGQSAESGDTEVAKSLIQKGADLNSIDDLYGETPLHRAARNGHTTVVE